MRGKVEDHVDVQDVEIGGGDAYALEYLRSAAVFLVAVHLAQQAVVKALDSNGQALHAPLEFFQVGQGEVVGVGLAADLFDREQVAS